MANLFSQSQVEGILAPLGFSGSATGGAAQAFINSNPAAQAAYNQAVQQQVGGNMTVAQPQQAPVATPMTGAMPVGVEPFNQYQRGALSALGTYQAPQFTQQAGEFLQNTMNQAQLGPLTDEQFQAGVSRYTNPYQQQVTDAAIQDISDQAAQLRNRIESRNPGARSFGSSSQGVQLASLAGDTMDAIGRTSATSGAQGFNSAVQQMMNERQQQLSGLGTAGNLASQLGGLGTGVMNQQLGALDANLGAGTTIQNFNQGLSNLAMQNYMGAQNYPLTNLQNVGTLMGVIPQTSVGYTQQPSFGQQLGGGLMSLGGLYGGRPVVQ